MSFRPGLTGLWQVSGRSNITDFEEAEEVGIIRINSFSLIIKVIGTRLRIIQKIIQVHGLRELWATKHYMWM